MIAVTVRTTGNLDVLIERLKGREMAEFLASQGDEMVAQVRANIVRKGALASSDWPRLSRPYARRKAKGKTPGRGKHKQAMLRDTGKLHDSLVAQVVDGPNGPRMILDAVGGRRSGGKSISNSRLLEIHANGEGRMPARHPALVEDMGLFIKRLERNLKAWLDAAA